MRKSLLIAALSACLPMFAVDGEGAALPPTDAAPSSTEPVQPVDTGNAAGGASQDAQSPAVTSAADASATASAEVAQAGESASGAPLQPALSTSLETEAGNVGTQATGVAAGEAGNGQLPPTGASTAAELPADGAPLVPNADASPAASGPASATASSVQIAPLDVGTEADQPATAHPAHSFADRIHSLAFTLAGSGDSMLSRMGYEITKLVAELKSVL
ncbi:hypothetical protein PQR01_00355 [Paraburkholderia rhynchosiae]|uniref:Uncharacterized protein n=1 Tax=Paraburkholderia rhynchosiae TaxID=487049 RepID=A0ACC7N4G6_9BURK